VHTLLRFRSWVLYLVPALAIAQSPFDGVWRYVPGSDRFPTRPDAYLLQDGTYHCPTCDPPLEVPADGQDHKIAASCYDTVSVKVVDDRTIQEVDKRSGKTVGTSRMTVAADGQTAIIDWTEMCNTKGDLVTAKKSMERVAKGPAGAHAVSGSWRILKYLDMSENALSITLKLEGNTFYFTDPAGYSFAAKLDGTDAPFKGDLENIMVSVKRIDQNTIEETDKRDGKVVRTIRFTVRPDGKTMISSGGDRAKGTAWEFAAEKQ